MRNEYQKGKSENRVLWKSGSGLEVIRRYEKDKTRRTNGTIETTTGGIKGLTRDEKRRRTSKSMGDVKKRMHTTRKRFIIVIRFI